MNKIIFATGNQHKVEELIQIFRMHSPENPIPLITSLAELGYTQDIPEDYHTIEENAQQKAQVIFESFNIPCFAEDTGLEVQSLGGAPGVQSARYAGSHRNDRDNLNLLLKNMMGETDRAARFRTVIAYTPDGTNFHFFEGVVNGLITPQPRGEGGFGYDPVFQPEGHHQTFGELSIENKNKISHRYQATIKFFQFLESLQN